MNGVQNFSSNVYRNTSNKSIDGQNKNEDKKSKPGAKAITCGYLAGSAVSSIVGIPNVLLSPKLMQKMKNLSDSITPDELEQIEKTATNIIKTSGLEEKGVSVIKATKDNVDEITKIFEKEANKGILKYYPSPFKERVINNLTSAITECNNASYTFASKKIVMPEKDMWLAFFHETGHAINANIGKTAKVLQKCRPMSLLVYPISMIALLKNKKAPDEQPKNSLDKATTFVKNNAGKLTFVSFLPLLVEEGLASIKGNSYAKKFLNPNLTKKVVKSNALGFSTYLLMATLTGLGIFLGTNARDFVVQNIQKATEK